MSSKTENGGDSNIFSKTWELNMYEFNRIPHEIIYDDTEIAVSPKILQNELMCPICLDILKFTMTTKECLHRFCHDCIITALRAGNKECPTCRKKLVSKRSLRPDPNFDSIIAKIYPNREEYETLHERVLEKLNKKHLTSIGGLTNTPNNKSAHRQNSRNATNGAVASTGVSNLVNESSNTSAATSKSTKENENNDELNGDEIKNLSISNNTKTNENTATVPTSSNRLNKRNLQSANHSDDSDMESRTSTEQSSLHLANEPDEIELILKPHPTKEISLSSKRFLKTTANATITHLSKYLLTRLCVEDSHSKGSALTTASNSMASEFTQNDFQLFVSSNEKLANSFQLLNQNLSLDQCIDQYWKMNNKPLELFYFYIKTSGNQNGNSNGLEYNNNSNSSSSISSNSTSSN